MPHAIYICNRVADEPHPQVLSEPRQCEKCGEAVWITPDKYAEISERADITLVCTPCQSEARAATPAEPEVESEDA